MKPIIVNKEPEKSDAFERCITRFDKYKDKVHFKICFGKGNKCAWKINNGCSEWNGYDKR